MRSLNDAVKVLNAVRPQTTTGTGTPTDASVEAIDTLGYNTALFNVAVGTATGTTTAVTLTLDAKVQECATSDGIYTDVTGATMTRITAVVGAGKVAQIPVEGLGTSRLRYLKLVITPAVAPATDARLPVSGTVLLGRAYQDPVGNSSVAA